MVVWAFHNVDGGAFTFRVTERNQTHICIKYGRASRWGGIIHCYLWMIMIIIQKRSTILRINTPRTVHLAINLSLSKPIMISTINVYHTQICCLVRCSYLYYIEQTEYLYVCLSQYFHFVCYYRDELVAREPKKFDPNSKYFFTGFVFGFTGFAINSSSVVFGN